MKNCLILIMLFLIVGCSNFDSIRIGAGYEGITGEVEIVLNDHETKDAGGIVFDKIGPDGTKENLFSFTQDEILGIYEKMKDKIVEHVGDVSINTVQGNSYKYKKIKECIND